MSSIPIKRRHDRSVARKRQRRRDIYKLWRKEQNSRYLGIDKPTAIKIRKNNNEGWKYDYVVAPVNFSFNDNPEGVIKLIEALENNYKSKRKTYVKMDQVENIDHGAILTLLAIMVHFKAKKIQFNGNTPRDAVASKMLTESGFFKHLGRSINESDRYKLENNGKNEIITHAWKKVDSELGDRVITSACLTVWGEKRRCQGVQRTLVELMHNTNNHASISGIGKTHWWLFVHHDENEHVARFAFVDFGIGVFTSLNNKPKDSKFFNWKEKVLQFISWTTNADLLKSILNGKFHSTVTGKYFRGKGLPGVAETETRNQISSLKIITNDAYASPADDLYKSLEASFNGTYLYWELRRNNESCGEEEI